MNKSPKEEALDRRILRLLPDFLSPICKKMLHDPEIKALQDYANTVSIKRLGFNDHGPVHMRKVVENSLTMAALLRDAHIPLSLQTEGIGTYEDSIFALFTAGLLHDVGMSLTRQDHENYSAELARPIIERFLLEYAPEDIQKRVIMRSLILESIVGHMGAVRVFSLEAGLILIADGCDMEKGRARIPLLINTEARPGDIHKYSSTAVEWIHFSAGSEKPIKIDIEMNESVGFFQVEEVLFPKLNVSSAKKYIELYAGVPEEPRKRYL